ncbi:MAG TPA: DNA internalization-related competence protein ComEC/Rec2 [Lachnospiraceae bacterium]|nr:DNA internalization-related competence protein ComEC/Rec2 [Lachnospiraceae bacterium]
MRRPLCVVCLAFVITIMLFYKLRPIPLQDIGDLEGQVVLLQGQVYQKEYKNDSLVIYVKKISIGDHSADISTVMCYMKSEYVTYLGQTVLLKGKLQSFSSGTNPGEFNLRKYYKVLGIDAKLMNVSLVGGSKEYNKWYESLNKVKKHFERIIDQILPEVNASIMKAMLLGNKKELDITVKDLYQRSGIAHILAISGLHISLIGVGLYQLLRRIHVPILVATGIAIFIMINYGIMIGLSASSYRAIVMFVLQVSAKVVKRTYDTLTALALASLLILVEQPLYIYHTGFLLSFGAVMGVALLYPLLSKWIPCKNKILQSFQASLSISLFTLPVILYSYYEFPLYSILLNLIVIPTMVIVVFSGVVLVLSGSIWITLGKIASIPCSVFLKIYEGVCYASLKLPGSTWIIGQPKEWQIFIYYVLLISVVFFIKNNKKWFQILIIMGAFIVLVNRFNQGTMITMLDVGQGDSICIQSESGHTYLIDGGSTSKTKVGTYQIIPFLKFNGIKKIEYIFITHLDSDHYNGILELIESGRIEGLMIGKIVLPNAAVKDDAYLSLMEVCKTNGITVEFMKTGDTLNEKFITLTCLHPTADYVGKDRNAASLVLQLDCDDFHGIFTGDLEAEGEQLVIKQISEMTKYDFLKVAHHGSKTSSTMNFLEKTVPKIAIISCGKGNRYGHPNKETLENLNQVTSHIYMTKDQGAISILLKKGKMVVKGFISRE